MNAKDRRFVMSVCLISAMMGAAGAHLLTVRDAWAQSNTLRTQRLELVDTSGKLRGVLSTTQKGKPFLALFSEERKMRLLISLSEDADTPLIALNGTIGHDIIALAVNGDNTAAINFSDKSNEVRGSITIDDKGNLQIDRSDAKGKTTHLWP